MNRDKVKCYIYTRVSTAIQVDGYSLDAQRETMRKYADFQNMEIVREYSDEGHSGKNIRGRQELTERTRGMLIDRRSIRCAQGRGQLRPCF